MNNKVKALIPYCFLMLITPVISLFLGNKDKYLVAQTKKWLLIIFITIFGATINIKSDADASRHQIMVEKHYSDKTLSNFSAELYKILTLEPVSDAKNDLYFHVLGYSIGGILQLPGLFFVIVAFIYAYFYIGSIFKVLKLVRNNPWSRLGIAFLGVFIVWKTIHDFQTVRTWTGLWVMVYASLSYFETKNKKYLGMLALPPLFHFGYFIIVIPAWIVVFLGNIKIIYTIIFFLSFLTQLIPEHAILNQLNKSSIGSKKIEGYYVEPEERIDEGNLSQDQKKKDSRFYKAFVDNGIHFYGYIISTIVIIVSGAYFLYMNYLESCLFSVGILAKSLSNSTFFIFALSNRSEHVAAVFILAAISLLLLRNQYWINLKTNWQRIVRFSLWISFLIISPLFIYKIAGFLGWVSIFIFFFPFVPWITGINFSIREAILHFF